MMRGGVAFPGDGWHYRGVFPGGHGVPRGIPKRAWHSWGYSQEGVVAPTEHSREGMAFPDRYSQQGVVFPGVFPGGHGISGEYPQEDVAFPGVFLGGHSQLCPFNPTHSFTTRPLYAALMVPRCPRVGLPLSGSGQWESGVRPVPCDCSRA